MKLLVDIGNTRVKWACGGGKTLSGHDGFFYAPDTISELLAKNWQVLSKPEQVYIASVADFSITEKIRDFTSGAWSLEPHVAVTEKERDGLKNAYSDVRSMGVDRWLAMLSAWNKFGAPVCVIDYGTAVTVDVILEGGQHIGGFILPGLTMTTDALIKDTHQIHVDNETSPKLEFGCSTSECIKNGFVFALAGLIDRCVKKISIEKGAELLLVITGGGAEQALPLLHGKYFHEPHLVLEGLNLIRISHQRMR